MCFQLAHYKLAGYTAPTYESANQSVCALCSLWVSRSKGFDPPWVSDLLESTGEHIAPRASRPAGPVLPGASLILLFACRVAASLMFLIANASRCVADSVFVKLLDTFLSDGAFAASFFFFLTTLDTVPTRLLSLELKALIERGGGGRQMYKHGRTETVRSATPESHLMCQV